MATSEPPWPMVMVPELAFTEPFEVREPVIASEEAPLTWTEAVPFTEPVTASVPPEMVVPPV